MMEKTHNRYPSSRGIGIPFFSMLILVILCSWCYGIENGRSVPVPNQPGTLLFGYSTTTCSVDTTHVDLNMFPGQGLLPAFDLVQYSVSSVFALSTVRCQLGDLFCSSTTTTQKYIALFDTSSTGGIGIKNFRYGFWVRAYPDPVHIPFTSPPVFFNGCWVIQSEGLETGGTVYR